MDATLQDCCRKKLLLIDGHALAFRQYYALERTGMRTASGVPSWAVYGFFKAVFDLLKNMQPDAIAVTFDVSHKTFRTEKFVEYKANRSQMPDEMRTQMGLIMEGLSAFNIPIYTKEGFEADDVIGTISKKVCAEGNCVYILTGDQDAFQLVDKEGCVKVVLPLKGELVEFDWDKVYEKWGVYPNQVVDYKALRGDTSDNIPGIKGIGEKTAQKLLSEYSTLDNLYANIENIAGDSLKLKIENGKESAYLSQYLARIICDLDIDFRFDDACVDLPDLVKVTDFLTKMQFFTFQKNIKNILATFNRASCADIDSALTEVSAKNEENFAKTLEYVREFSVENFEDLKSLVAKIQEQKAFFFATQSSGESVISQTITTISIGLVNEVNFIDNKISFNFGEKNNAEVYSIDFAKLDKVWLLEFLKPIFEANDIIKFTIDSKKEYNVLRSFGIGLESVKFDAILASYVSNSTNGHDLEFQALQCLGISPENENASQNTDAPIQLGLLSSLDNEKKTTLKREIWLLILLLQYRIKNMSATNWNLLYKMEIPLAKVLAEMEFNGVSVNTETLKKLDSYLDENLTDLSRQIYDLAGVEFNINSPKQVGQILYENMGIQLKKKRAKNKKATFSTSAEVLEELAEEHLIAKLLLQYRKFAKFKSTYTDALPLLINSKDNRIHTTYNQTATSTGRLSSSNPNLQSIPIRSDEGERIRATFVAQKQGDYLISADYSQIELRMLAHMSNDPNLKSAFEMGVDIHAITAAKIYGVELSEVTKKMRSFAKSVNFGIVYGQTKYGLAKALGISNEEAEDFINKYFETYPVVKTYIASIIQFVEKEGFTETIFGRKRYFANEIASSNAVVRDIAKRAAVNFPMQGSAADLMKFAMVRFYTEAKRLGLKSKLIMQVHDEMVVEAPADELDLVKELLVKSMELEQPLGVPLVVNVKIGEHW